MVLNFLDFVVFRQSAAYVLVSLRFNKPTSVFTKPFTDDSFNDFFYKFYPNKLACFVGEFYDHLHCFCRWDLSKPSYSWHHSALLWVAGVTLEVFVGSFLKFKPIFPDMALKALWVLPTHLFDYFNLFMGRNFISRFKYRRSYNVSSKFCLFYRNYPTKFLSFFSLPLRFFKRYFFLKKKKLKNLGIKIIFFIKYNKLFFFKGKNPRMGKGKGLETRGGFFLKKKLNIFLLKRGSDYRATSLSCFLKKETRGFFYQKKYLWYF